MAHGKTFESVTETVFNTPLIRLRRVIPDSHATVYVKGEAFNPMASVKDRIALAMIEDAEANGKIGPGTHIIEPTSGNTGIALAFVCASRGYKLTLTMPESMSMERRVLLRSFGAELVLTPAAEGMKGAVARAMELSEQTPGSWVPQQFDNPANPAVHERTTGPELWEDTKGAIDILVAGVGTGGTITGSTRYIRKHKPSFQAIAVEPSASPVISGGKPAPHKIQGIGAGFVPKNLDTSLLNGIEQVSNEERSSGRVGSSKKKIFAGISTSANVCARPESLPNPRTAARLSQQSGAVSASGTCQHCCSKASPANPLPHPRPHFHFLFPLPPLSPCDLCFLSFDKVCVSPVRQPMSQPTPVRTPPGVFHSRRVVL